MKINRLKKDWGATATLAFLAAGAWTLPTVAARPQLYQNFSLPLTRANLPPPPLAYRNARVEVKDRRVSVKEPGANHQQFLFAKEAYLSEKRDEAIRLLRQELDSGYKRNQDNLLLRLGQLYAEKYMELSYRENESYNQKLNEYEKNKSRNVKTKTPTLDASRSQRYLKQALNVFYALERTSPNHPKIDEIFFFIGFVEMEGGNGPKGARYLEKVIQKYPRSRKYDEAVVYLGDYYFEKHKFKESADKFRILVGKRDASLHHYGIYKIAWCNLNLKQEMLAIRQMKSLVAELQGSKEPAKFNLREQALRDLVIFYGEVGAVDEAMDYFAGTVGKEQALENLKIIADILRSKARDEQAIKAYDRLLKEFGDSIEAPRFVMGMYDCLSRLGRNETAINVLIKAIERYGSDSSWAKSFDSGKAVEVKSALNQLQQEGERIALYYHHSAQKSSNKGSYNYALRIYSALIAHFPEHPNRKKIAFYRAEILFAQEKWVDAAESYMEAARIPPKDKLADEAVYNALLALDHMIAKDEKLTRYTKEEQKKVSLESESIPSNEQRFIALAETYIRDYPQGSRIVDVRFRIAAIYYRHRHFDKALESFKDIADKHPKHRSATTAAYLVLDIYNIKKDYDSLDTFATAYAANSALGDEKFKTDMAEIKAELGFKKIEPLENQNKWREAGDAYAAFFKNNPKNAVADKALYNSYVSYDKAGDAVKAEETAKLFLAKYPSHEYSQRLLLNMARLSEKRYDYEDAQRYYLAYAKKFPKDKEAKKALYNAAVFAELLEQNASALNLYEQYARENRISADEQRAIWVSQAKLYRKQGNFEKMTTIYRRLARESKNAAEKLNTLAELARINERAGRRAERDSLVNEMRWLYDGAPGLKNAGQAAPFVAEAKFHAIDKQRDKYFETKLRFPPDDLIYLMKVKQKQLNKLVTAYDAIIDIGVPEWGVAALHEKSLLYDDYVRSYRSVAVPKKYAGKEREEIDKQMKEIDQSLVAPLESKSKEFAKSCVERSADFNVASDYAMKCRDKARRWEADKWIEPAGTIPHFSDLQNGYAKSRADASELIKKGERPSFSDTKDFIEYVGALDTVGRYNDAFELSKRFLTEHPEEKRMVFLLAVSAYHLKKRELANFFFGQLEKDSRFDGKSYLLTNLGLFAQQEGKREVAIDYFEKAASASPDAWAAHFNSGIFALQSRNFAKAERAFNSAMRLNEDSDDVVQGLGMALEGLGKFDDAHRLYASYVNGHPRATNLLYSDSIVLGNRLKKPAEGAALMQRYLQAGGKETAKAHEMIQNWR